MNKKDKQQKIKKDLNELKRLLTAKEAEVRQIEKDNGRPFNELWLEVENNPHKWTEENSLIHKLERQVHTIKKLIKRKEKELAGDPVSN
jgi:hypothetical protein